MTLKLPITLLAALAITAGLVSCGGGDETVSGEREARAERPANGPGRREPGKATHRRLLDEICLAADRGIARAEQQELGKRQPSLAELQRFYDEVVVPTRQGQLDAMQRIELPAQAGTEVGLYLNAFLDAVRTIGEKLALIKNPGIERIAFDDAKQLASVAGLRRCAE